MYKQAAIQNEKESLILVKCKNLLKCNIMIHIIVIV